MFFIIIGYAIIQLPEFILSLHGFILNKCYKSSLLYSSIAGKHDKRSNLGEPKKNDKVMKRSTQSWMEASYPEQEYSLNANEGVKEKFRYILRRMDQQDLKWEQKFELLMSRF